MSKKRNLSTIIFSFFLIFLLSQSIPLSVKATTQNFQFPQLEEYFDQSLFGINFDYNSGESPENALRFIKDEITKEIFSNQTDPNENLDNVITLIGHESNQLKSIILAVDKIKRTESIPFGEPIQWETSVPFTKYSLVIPLQSGENVIFTQDLLGLVLRIEDTTFDYNQYQVGYANVPLDILDFLMEQIPISYNASSMDIALHESHDDLIVTTEYTNVTYLFQNQDIDFEEILSFELSDHFLLAQFDSITITLKLLNYDNPSYSGVDTQIEIQIGNVVNLIINEALPTDLSWNSSVEKHIETSYNDVFEINETFSWYRFDDIHERIGLFNRSALSYLLSQNLGILNDTNSISEYNVSLSGENVTRSDLAQYDYLISDNITIQYNSSFQCVTHVNGHDYSIIENPKTNSLTLGDISYTLISLNQHPSLSSNMLFIRETSLLNTILAESIRHSVNNENITVLSTDQLLRLTNMYFSASVYTLDLRMEEWKGYPTSINILQTIQRNQIVLDGNRSNVTSFPSFTVIMLIFVVLPLYRRKKLKRDS